MMEIMGLYNKIKYKLHEPRIVFCILSTIILMTNTLGNWGLLSSVTAQSSAEIGVSIVREATNLDDQSYQPNPLSVKVGDTVIWTNDDSTRHTVTERSTSISNNNQTIDESENEGSLFEKILKEIIANISYNLNNVIGNKEDSLSNDSENDSETQSNSSKTSNTTLQLDSGMMESGDSYEYTFNESGIFEYYCTIHPNMAGTVEVVDNNK